MKKNVNVVQIWCLTKTPPKFQVIVQLAIFLMLWWQVYRSQRVLFQITFPRIWQLCSGSWATSGGNNCIWVANSGSGGVQHFRVINWKHWAKSVILENGNPSSARRRRWWLTLRSRPSDTLGSCGFDGVETLVRTYLPTYPTPFVAVSSCSLSRGNAAAFHVRTDCCWWVFNLYVTWMEFRWMWESMTVWYFMTGTNLEKISTLFQSRSKGCLNRTGIDLWNVQYHETVSKTSPPINPSKWPRSVNVSISRAVMAQFLPAMAIYLFHIIKPLISCSTAVPDPKPPLRQVSNR